jgi:hypothetical protein
MRARNRDGLGILLRVPRPFRAPPLPTQNTQAIPVTGVCWRVYALHLIRWVVRFAQVKEEPAQRAGDTEQNVQPNVSTHAGDGLNFLHVPKNQATGKIAGYPT